MTLFQLRAKFSHLFRRLPLSAAFYVVLSLITIANLTGCNKKSVAPAAGGKSPAKVEKLPTENELSNITLTEEAEKHLGITAVAAIVRDESRSRTLGGEVMVPTGKAIIVSAPLSGTVQRAAGQPLPLPGTAITAGSPILNLVPILSAERDAFTPAEQVQVANARATLIAAHLTAQGDVDRSRAEAEAAKITMQRAEKLWSDRAGSRRMVDDAQAQISIAQSVNAAAKQREQQLSHLLSSLDAPSGARPSGAPLPLIAPVSGVLRSLQVSEGQTVASAAPLFEIIDNSVMWIRVPVYVDLISSLNLTKSARVVRLDGRATTAVTEAKPIAAPPTADALSSSADLYFQIDNASAAFRPGQRLGVAIALGETQSATIVPAAAVLFDIHGGTWVYTVVGPRKYVRQRVQLNWIDGADAILSLGPKAGTQVVVAGSAELFGTEFGAGK